MGAMCLARARALVQDFDETGCGGRGKMRKNRGKIRAPMAYPRHYPLSSSECPHEGYLPVEPNPWAPRAVASSELTS